MNIRLNLKYLALLVAALMLISVVAVTASTLLNTEAASARPKPVEEAYKHPNAGGGNGSETQCSNSRSGDCDPGNKPEANKGSEEPVSPTATQGNSAAPKKGEPKKGTR